MDEIIFDKIRSISYDKYNSDGYRTFTFTVGQYIRSVRAVVTRIVFDEIRYINTKDKRYVIYIIKDDNEFDEPWKGIPAYKSLVEQDLSL